LPQHLVSLALIARDRALRRACASAAKTAALEKKCHRNVEKNLPGENERCI